MVQIESRVREGSEEEQCPNCGSWYKELSIHWARSDCDHPDLTDKQIELLKGMMFGDGTLSCRHTHPSMRIAMINKTFLEWLDEELGWLTSGVSLNKTAWEQGVNDSGVDNDINPKNCHDYYRIGTKSHPSLSNFETWYDSGSIRFPEDAQLTPLSLKMWYVSDGGLCWQTNSRVEFSSMNEADRPEVLINIFKRAGFNVSYSGKMARLKTEDTERFFDFIGDAPPGFEYKWCYESKEEYQQEKKAMFQEHCTQTFP